MDANNIRDLSNRSWAPERTMAEVLIEIAAQLAELVAEQRIKNASLKESIDLQREELTHRYEHNARMLDVFSEPVAEPDPQKDRGLAERLKRIEKTLSTFIAWSERELGSDATRTLLDMLAEPRKHEGEVKP